MEEGRSRSGSINIASDFTKWRQGVFFNGVPGLNLLVIRKTNGRFIRLNAKSPVCTVFASASLLGKRIFEKLLQRKQTLTTNGIKSAVDIGYDVGRLCLRLRLRKAETRVGGKKPGLIS